MKTLFYFTLLFAMTTHAWALDFEAPTLHSKKYLVVGVSGFKTGRDKEETDNILSNLIGKGFEPSGAWENLPTRHKKIFKNAYLTHFSSEREIDSVLSLILDENKECKKDVGLIMMINSWGAKTSQKLAKKYLEKCGTLPALSILIEGVSKPTPLSYDKPIMAFNCVNFYQRLSKLKGTAIANCHNNQIRYESDKMDLFMAHIHAEWDGSSKGQRIILDYLDEKLPVMFVRDLYGVSYQEGLE